MQAAHQAYLNNLADARSLVKPHFENEVSDEAVIAAIRRNAAELYRLHGRTLPAVWEDIPRAYGGLTR